MLMDHNEYARERALRDPDFASAIRERAIELLEGNEEDRRIAFRILQNQLGLTEDQAKQLDHNKATA